MAKLLESTRAAIAHIGFMPPTLTPGGETGKSTAYPAESQRVAEKMFSGKLFGNARAHSETGGTDPLGPETRRRGRPAFARHFAARHEGLVEENAQGRSESIETLPPADRAVMEPHISGLACPAGAEDFPQILRRQGLLQPVSTINHPLSTTFLPTESTTILAFKFADGVLVAGDRRATSGNTVVYDRADKVLEIDTHSIMAIAGVPATAWEMARVLEHSFQFFRRTQLQEMSVDGKVRALSKLLRDNFGFALQGVGIVVPIFATFELTASPAARLYFYDAMGAQFEATDFAATGSGSPAVRGILYYENTWGQRRLQKLSLDEAVVVALRALDTASEADTATGGIDRQAKIFPVMKIVSAEGITTLSEDKMSQLFRERVA